MRTGFFGAATLAVVLMMPSIQAAQAQSSPGLFHTAAGSSTPGAGYVCAAADGTAGSGCGSPAFAAPADRRG